MRDRIHQIQVGPLVQVGFDKKPRVGQALNGPFYLSFWYILRIPRLSTEAGDSAGDADQSGILTVRSWRLGTGWGVGREVDRLPSILPSPQYRIASISKIFPVLLLYRLWEEGIVASLDDPLERYASTFSIHNPLGKTQDPEPQDPAGQFEEMDSLPKPSSVTLRRMASQLSGEPQNCPAEPIHIRGPGGGWGGTGTGHRFSSIRTLLWFLNGHGWWPWEEELR